MLDSLNYIQSLQEAIRKAHGCESNHAGSVPIEEVFQGKAVWSGTVEVFQIIGHPTASLCYAWGHAARDTGNEVRIVTVLGVRPIDSPRKAVQASIVADANSGD